MHISPLDLANPLGLQVFLDPTQGMGGYSCLGTREATEGLAHVLRWALPC